MTAVEFTNLPAEGRYYPHIHLCQRVETTDVPLYCATQNCQRELPHCKLYKLSNIKSEEAEDGKTYQFGHFECTLCDDLYEPVEEAPVENPLDPTEIKYLCKRREGVYECGEACQRELPGCLQFSVSRVESRIDQYGRNEYARFLCIEPDVGYEKIDKFDLQSAETNVTKQTTLREYESPRIECDDIRCRHVFPACNAYYSLSFNDETNKYRCLECRTGYKPVNLDVVGIDFNLLSANRISLNLCQLVNSTSIDTNADWKEEMPGCLKFSISDVYTSADGNQEAVYKCLECEPGLEIIEDNEPEIVHANWELSSNAKARCRPLSFTEPVDCDDSCRRRLKYCQEYTIRYKSDQKEFVDEIECVRCDDGFEPVKTPVDEPWYYMEEIHVCKRAPTNGPIDCDDKCKEVFPNCDRVEVSTDPKGHQIYQCHQCSVGYHTIDYEDVVRGRISEVGNPMRNFNQIFLCTEEPNEVYIDKFDCDEGDPSIFDSRYCHSSANCRTLVEVYNVMYGEYDTKCVRCDQGFRPKKERPNIYDIDQSLCEPVPSSSPLRLFKK